MSPKQPPQDQSDSNPSTVVSDVAKNGARGLDLDSFNLTDEQIEHARRWMKLRREWNGLLSEEMDLTERRTALIVAVVVTVFAMAFVTLAAIFRPWLIPMVAGTGGIAVLLHRWWLARKRGRHDEGDDHGRT